MHIVITGASKGVGYATARELGARGHQVTSLSRSPAPSGVSHVLCDVASRASVEAAWRHLSGVDVLVNNAGVDAPAALLERRWDAWDAIMQTNLAGAAYNTAQFVAQAVKRRVPGRIVNVASTAALGPRPGRAAYAASKAALASLSLSWAEELRPYGIRVYCVALGPCDTDLRRALFPDEDPSRNLTPEEAARSLADLCEDGEYLDGQVITLRRR